MTGSGQGGDSALAVLPLRWSVGRAPLAQNLPVPHGLDRINRRIQVARGVIMTVSRLLHRVVPPLAVRLITITPVVTTTRDRDQRRRSDRRSRREERPI